MFLRALPKTKAFQSFLLVFSLISGSITIPLTVQTQTNEFRLTNEGITPGYAFLGDSGYTTTGVGISQDGVVVDQAGTMYRSFRDRNNQDRFTVQRFTGLTWETLGTPGAINTGGGILKIDANNELLLLVREAVQPQLYKYNAVEDIFEKVGGFVTENMGFVSFVRDFELVVSPNNEYYVALATLGNSQGIKIAKYEAERWLVLGEFSGADEVEMVATGSDELLLLSRGDTLQTQRYRNQTWQTSGQGDLPASYRNLHLVAQPDGTLSLVASSLFGNAPIKKYEFSDSLNSWREAEELGWPEASIDNYDYLVTSAGTFLAVELDNNEGMAQYELTNGEWIPVYTAGFRDRYGLADAFVYDDKLGLGVRDRDTGVYSLVTLTSTLPVQKYTGQTDVVTLTSEGGTGNVTYEIIGGADFAEFEVVSQTGQLSFKSPLRYLDPRDENVDNVYEVEVRATDSTQLAAPSLFVQVEVLADPSLAVEGLGAPWNEVLPSPLSDDTAVLNYDFEVFEGEVYVFWQEDTRTGLIDNGTLRPQTADPDITSYLGKIIEGEIVEQVILTDQTNFFRYGTNVKLRAVNGELYVVGNKYAPAPVSSDGAPVLQESAGGFEFARYDFATRALVSLDTFFANPDPLYTRVPEGENLVIAYVEQGGSELITRQYDFGEQVWKERNRTTLAALGGLAYGGHYNLLQDVSSDVIVLRDPSVQDRLSVKRLENGSQVTPIGGAGFSEFAQDYNHIPDLARDSQNRLYATTRMPASEESRIQVYRFDPAVGTWENISSNGIRNTNRASSHLLIGSDDEVYLGVHSRTAIKDPRRVKTFRYLEDYGWQDIGSLDPNVYNNSLDVIYTLDDNDRLYFLLANDCESTCQLFAFARPSNNLSFLVEEQTTSRVGQIIDSSGNVAGFIPNIIGGQDQNLFRVGADNELEFISLPDYEQPLDTDQNNVYELILELAQPELGLVVDQAVAQITVQDIAEQETPLNPETEPPLPDQSDEANQDADGNGAGSNPLPTLIRTGGS